MTGNDREISGKKAGKLAAGDNYINNNNMLKEIFFSKVGNLIPESFLPKTENQNYRKPKLKLPETVNRPN